VDISLPQSEKSLVDEGFLVVGVAKNCGLTIKNDLLILKRAFCSFKNVKWLIIISDTTDNTIDELVDTQRSIDNLRFIDLGKIAPEYPSRTNRIAVCRNKYLLELANNEEYKTITHLVVVDLDGVNDEITEDKVMSCFERSDWAACAANQSGPYYDIYALRHPIWSPNNCWEAQKLLRGLGLSEEDSFLTAVLSRMVHIPIDAGWIRVDSAFGGLAIYKVKYLHGCEYVGLSKDGGDVCEHVSFHEGINKNGGNLYINPKLVNAHLTEHSKIFLAWRALHATVNVEKDSLTTEQSLANYFDEVKRGDIKIRDYKNLNDLQVTQDDVIVFYKIFLNRFPENFDVIKSRIGMPTERLLNTFLGSDEFLSRNIFWSTILNSAKKILDKTKSNSVN